MPISSYASFRQCLEQDRLHSKRSAGAAKYFFDAIWQFTVLLRLCEWMHNRKHRVGYLLCCPLFRWRSRTLGFTIPINTCGPGLYVPHYGTIVINTRARIGRNCTIHTDVCIGRHPDSKERVPTLGDNIYIGPGAKIYDAITVANGATIGANAVVNRSFNEENCVLAGVPAKMLTKKAGASQPRPLHLASFSKSPDP
ncbi:transferase hexapeptide repeat containing protein [Ferrimonas balearica DSM 9799]|uniref:Transferase hexapeptide repeat containing protein n=1 Tax=Ferrimonas balearica (strain DSM 9799 / CCM 4581 / KCTC 23876 / PAT) TaxID=550540 RepID=E1SWI6_FERBD|nr:serine acetyltransferase [Ferrimonas balearica]ADN76468.1 transferase hexapeptide repeat containing protein [Ferrimonas balearica DSM 9799]MBW3139368.1 serine acetyltransferase [Ferrimonas balearica]MBW3163042.1 serine acetyltransferase [Ferrimonas balearica]MBY5980735.1 serine acetyltransferase [Ferrimonas balearica]MBY6106436.1 serine acetyltransferase [Ferrimonas balearica]